MADDGGARPKWVWLSCVWTGDGLMGLLSSQIAASLLVVLGSEASN
jgi:hypothetical protein